MNDAAHNPLDAIPFPKDLGIEFRYMKEGAAEVGLVLQTRHTNSWKVAHGGITMTMLDIAMSMAGRSLDPQTRAGVTIEMKTSFLQPAGKIGDRLIAKGRAVHRSTSLCFCSAELWNGERLVAQASGTFKYMKRLVGGDVA